MDEAELSSGVTDLQILKAAHKTKKIVLTCDKGSGFSIEKITNSNIKNTGVVILEQKYDEDKMDLSAYRLTQVASQEDLTGARTEVTLEGARIHKSKKKTDYINF